MIFTPDISVLGAALRRRPSWRRAYKVAGHAPSMVADFVAGIYGAPFRAPLDELVSVERGTSGMAMGPTGFYTVSAADQPRRVFDPVTHEAAGLYIEGARTNVSSHSVAVQNWASDGCTLIADALSAPDGTITADLVKETVGSGHHRVKQMGVSIAPGVYTASIFARSTTRAIRITLFDGGGGWQSIADFDLVTGTVTSSLGSTLISARIMPYANGWYRCVLVGNCVTASANAQMLVNLTAGAPIYNGDGVSGAYLWGGQLEAGYGASSPILTTGNPQTRAADKAQIALGDWWAGTGTLFCSGVSHPASRGRSIWAALPASAVGDMIALQRAEGGNLEVVVERAGASVASLSLGPLADDTAFNVAVSFGGESLKAAVNGGAAVSVALDAPPTGLTKLQLGGNAQEIGHITLKQIRYFAPVLSGEELSSATA